MEENYGHLEIRLAELIEKKGLNRNKVLLKAAMNWRQADRYCEDDIISLDTFVLCKLCTVLECEIQDLLVSVPAEKEQER